MRLGGTDTYTIDDVVFHVKRAWGPRRDHQAVVRANPPKDVETQAQLYERLGILEKCSIDLIEATVVGVDGLQDAAGHPVEWSVDLLSELPEPMVEELAQRITFSRSDDAIRADPNATAPSAMPSEPSITTEDAA